MDVVLKNIPLACTLVGLIGVAYSLIGEAWG